MVGANSTAQIRDSRRYIAISAISQVAREAREFGITVQQRRSGTSSLGPRVGVAWDNDTDDPSHARFDGAAMKRLGTATDLASAILYVVSPQAADTTGQTLLVDGGDPVS